MPATQEALQAQGAVGKAGDAGQNLPGLKPASFTLAVWPGRACVFTLCPRFPSTLSSNSYWPRPEPLPRSHSHTLTVVTHSYTADPPPTCSLTATLHALSLHHTNTPSMCLCVSLPHPRILAFLQHTHHTQSSWTPHTQPPPLPWMPHMHPQHTLQSSLAQPTPAFSLLQPERTLPKIPLGLLLTPAQKLPSSTPS